jgi:sulfatase modifying factor 1
MKQISRFAALALVLIAVSSCKKKPSGQLTGVQERPKWKGINPYGMVYIPSGTLTIGPSDQDMNFAKIQRSKSISINGFFMDDTEITNNEYRQFVNYVRDSVAHKILGHIIQSDNGGPERIDWEQEIDWAGEGEDNTALDEMYYAENERYQGRKQLNPKKLEYEWEWYDWKEAAKSKNKGADRLKFIKKEKTNIFPDTLCWVRDFSYSYNEPMTRNYFYHVAFDDYPVVGVDWTQASSFAAWRSKTWNDYLTQNGETMYEDFRLPTEHEWEYAARGGKELAPYPWGGPYLRNAKGCLLANFKPMRGNYPEDGGFYTVKANAYFPNDYGLYCMAGNVSEWTSSAFHENAYAFVHDMNPDIRYDAPKDASQTMKRKVVRGGSWKDIGYYLQTGTRSYEYQDSAKSYHGFRCALTFLGRSMNDFK